MKEEKIEFICPYDSHILTSSVTICEENKKHNVSRCSMCVEEFCDEKNIK